MAEQQDFCLLAVKIAKVFLDGFELHSMYVGCLEISSGQRKRALSIYLWLHWRLRSFYVQKQGTVGAFFLFLHGKFRFSLY